MQRGDVLQGESAASIWQCCRDLWHRTKVVTPEYSVFGGAEALFVRPNHGPDKFWGVRFRISEYGFLTTWREHKYDIAELGSYGMRFECPSQRPFLESWSLWGTLKSAQCSARVPQTRSGYCVSRVECPRLVRAWLEVHAVRECARTPLRATVPSRSTHQTAAERKALAAWRRAARRVRREYLAVLS